MRIRGDDMISQPQKREKKKKKKSESCRAGEKRKKTT